MGAPELKDRRKGSAVTTDTRRVIAGVNGSVRSLAALRVAVAEAHSAGAMLLPLLAWEPVGGELAYLRAPCPILLRLWQHAAHERLSDAFDDAFGGMPDGLVIHPLVVRSAAGPALVGAANQSDDLLVVGGGGWGRFACTVHGSVSRYCLAHARCPVLAVPPPELIRELRPRRHHWRPEDFASPLAG
jgi:nucleotide-binding universal stress UspA family protein